MSHKLTFRFDRIQRTKSLHLMAIVRFDSSHHSVERLARIPQHRKRMSNNQK